MATIVTRARSSGSVPEFRTLSRDEGLSPDKLSSLVGAGRVVVPRNVVREDVLPIAIGEGMRVKINANIGSSQDICDVEEEMTKARSLSAGTLRRVTCRRPS